MKAVQRIAALLLTLAIAAAGCSTGKPPAPAGEQPVPPAPASPPPERTMTVAVYFADWQAQHLIPEPRQVPEADGAALADRVVQEILAGPADPHLLRSLPETVRLVEPVTVQNRVAYVNLSPEFLNVRGAAGVAMALGSLRLSLTDLPGVDRVQVLVDGKKDVELDEGVLLEPMDRGPVADFPVLFDPERGNYLQSRVDQGLDPWRTDPAAVARWEGRMFGFTEAELAAAVITPQGTVATAEVARGEIRYVIELVQQDGAGSNRIWLVRHIARATDLPAGGPSAGDPAHTVVTGQNVAVRAEPSLDAPVVERVSYLVLRRLDQGSGTGPTVELDGRTYRWLKVGLPAGETGYIADVSSGTRSGTASGSTSRTRAGASPSWWPATRSESGSGQVGGDIGQGAGDRGPPDGWPLSFAAPVGDNERRCAPSAPPGQKGPPAASPKGADVDACRDSLCRPPGGTGAGLAQPGLHRAGPGTVPHPPVYA